MTIDEARAKLVALRNKASLMEDSSDHLIVSLIVVLDDIGNRLEALENG